MSAPLFPITFWCGVPPERATPERYREIAEAGFSIAQVSGSKERIRRQLDWCYDAGITGMVIDGRIVSTELPSRPGWKDTVRAVVAEYREHPALWGYFVLDEPSAQQFPALAQIVAELRAQDPVHPAYINLFPNYANEQQLGTKTYEEHVRQYLAVVKPPLVSYDHYALMEGEPDRPEYFPNLETVRRLSLEAGLDFWQIILSTALHVYRNPTEADLRWQVWTTLAYGAKGISYFTYWTPDAENFRNGIIDPFGERTEHYAQVRLINREIRQLGPTLRGLTSVGVVHGSGASGRDARPRHVVTPITQPLVVGEFDGPDGQAAIILVNAELCASIHARLTVKPQFRHMRVVSRVTGNAGGQTPLSQTAEGPVVAAWLAPGDGTLVLLQE